MTHHFLGVHPWKQARLFDLDEVNASNPPNQQISRFGVNTKLGLVLGKHQEAFPGSGKRWLMLVLSAAGFACAATGALIAFFRYSVRWQG
jgi:hypothetical protein